MYHCNYELIVILCKGPLMERFEVQLSTCLCTKL